MEEIEFKIKNSFKKVQKDILEIKDQLLNLAESQKELRDMFFDLEKKVSVKTSSKKKTNKKK